MKLPVFLFPTVVAVVILLRGVVGDGDGAKSRYSEDEVLKKLPKTEKTIKCYTCQGCSDAKKLTAGTKVDCKGGPYGGEPKKHDPTDPYYDTGRLSYPRPAGTPLAYFEPHCFISFGAQGVIARGCLTNFLDQHTPIGGGIGGSGGVGGKCSEMKHEKGPLGSFSCWCSGNLCNFGSSLRSRITFVGVAAIIVVISHTFYTL